MPDNLDRYVPEFDEDEARAKLAGFNREQIIDMLIYSYKLRRVISKTADEETAKLRRIQEILSEPSRLSGMPGVPTAEDLRRMIEDQDI
jgi:hypothetical protein